MRLRNTLPLQVEEILQLQQRHQLRHQLARQTKEDLRLQRILQPNLGKFLTNQQVNLHYPLVLHFYFMIVLSMGFIY